MSEPDHDIPRQKIVEVVSAGRHRAATAEIIGKSGATDIWPQSLQPLSILELGFALLDRAPDAEG